jgi:hypothetical protein
MFEAGWRICLHPLERSPEIPNRVGVLQDLHDHDWQQKWDSIFKRLFGKNRA